MPIRSLPFDYPWIETTIVPPGIEVSSQANITTGLLGASIGATTAGYVFKLTSIAFDFVPQTSERLLITANTRVNFRGGFLAFFNGYGSAYAALRIWVQTPDGRITQSSNVLYDDRGVVGISFPVIELELRSASVTVQATAGRQMSIFVDAVQSVGALGLGVTAVSNLSMRVGNVTLTPVP